MDYNPQELEAEWRERWAAENRYEPDPTDAAAPEDEETTFITVPYPYPSGGMHIGHARTYTVPDVYARYRRQQGDNVLFPMAWHVTGTPIIGAVERLQKREESQLSVLQDTYNVSDDVLEDLETPMGYARHFIEEHYKQGMRSLGLSIDWRREFTTNDDRYSKFITWQYETLKERGRLEKGLHPVKYCTEQENPVTTHDLLEGEDVEYQEYTLIRFSHAGESESGDDSDDGTIIPMATLRPETVRGVTNAYINPEATYVEATVDGEEWLVSTEAAEKLELQDHAVDIGRECPGSEVVGEHVTNPVTGDEILILPRNSSTPTARPASSCRCRPTAPTTISPCRRRKPTPTGSNPTGSTPTKSTPSNRCRFSMSTATARFPPKTPSSPPGLPTAPIPNSKTSHRTCTTRSSTPAHSTTNTASTPVK
jgi:Leucyl-tRNA synthetase